MCLNRVLQCRILWFDEQLNNLVMIHASLYLQLVSSCCVSLIHIINWVSKYILRFNNIIWELVVLLCSICAVTVLHSGKKLCLDRLVVLYILKDKHSIKYKHFIFFITLFSSTWLWERYLSKRNMIFFLMLVRTAIGSLFLCRKTFNKNTNFTAMTSFNI